jgi:hypothetical protein
VPEATSLRDTVFSKNAPDDVAWVERDALSDVDTRDPDRWVMVVEAKVSLHDEVLTEVRANHGAIGGGPISGLLGGGAGVVFGPA